MTTYIVLVNNKEDIYHPFASMHTSKHDAIQQCKYEQEHGRTSTLVKYVGSYLKKEKEAYA